MAFNFTEQQKKRIYAQYRDKPKAVKWLMIYPEIANKFSTMMAMLKDSYVIEENEGEQLNVIGHVVGQNRQFQAPSVEVIVPTSDFCDPIPSDDFTSEAAQMAVYFVDEANQNQGGQCSPDSFPYTGQLSDIQYRQALKARIQKNASYATIDEIIEGVKLVLGEDTQVTLQDDLNMSFSISVSGVLTPEMEFALTTDLIVNRPQGVRFIGYTTNAPQFASKATVEAFPDSAQEFGQPLSKNIDVDDEDAKKAVYFTGALGGDS